MHDIKLVNHYTVLQQRRSSPVLFAVITPRFVRVIEKTEETFQPGVCCAYLPFEVLICPVDHTAQCLYS